MTTIQQDDAQHQPGDRGSGCCGKRGHRDDFEGRHALEKRQRDLEQELADVAGKLRDLPAEEPTASE